MTEPEITRHTLAVSRTARFHVLGGAAGEVREVWFALHGYGQLAEPFLGSLAALARPARILVAPEALSRFYLKRGTGEVGASWMTREERADEIRDTVGYLERVHEEVRRTHALRTPFGVCAFGFSQGGAAAARWAVLGSAPIGAVVSFGCPLPGDLDLAARRERVRALRWTFVLGDGDTSIDRDAWEQGLQRLRALEVEPAVVRFDGGHELPPAVLERVGGSPA